MYLGGVYLSIVKMDLYNSAAAGARENEITWDFSFGNKGSQVFYFYFPFE